MESGQSSRARADAVNTVTHVVYAVAQVRDVGRIDVYLFVQDGQVLTCRVFGFDVVAVFFNSCFVVNGAARDNAFIVFRDLAVRFDVQRVFYFLVSLFRFFYGDGVAFLDRVVRLRYVIRNIFRCGFQLRYVNRVGIFRARGYARDLSGRIRIPYRNGPQVPFDGCLYVIAFMEIDGFRIRFSTIRYGIAAKGHAACDGGVGVMSDDGGVFDVGFRAFIRRAEHDASVRSRQFSLVAEENRAGRVFDFVIRADHGDMGDIFRFIFETVHEVIGAYLIFSSREGIIDAHNLRRLRVVRGIAAADYHGRAAGLIVNGHFAEFFDQLVWRSRAAGNAVGKSVNALDRIGHFISRAENQSTVRIFRRVGETDNAVGNACRTAMSFRLDRIQRAGDGGAEVLSSIAQAVESARAREVAGADGIGADHRAENTFIKGICTHRGLVDVVAFPIRFGRDIGAAHLAQVGMRADLDTARASIRVGADSDSCRGPLRIVRCAKTQVFFLSSDTIENIRALANRHAAGQSCVRCYPGIVADRHGA